MRMTVLSLSLMLAACGSGGSDPKPVDARPTAGTQSNETPPVRLPPSIIASRSFRCKDNSVVSIDFLSDGRTANVSDGSGKPSVQVSSLEPGQRMSNGLWSVKGGSGDDVVTITSPVSQKTVSCHTGTRPSK